MLSFSEAYIKKMRLEPCFKKIQDVVFEFILNFFKSLELKNKLNFIYKNDYELYKKLAHLPSRNYSHRNPYDASIVLKLKTN